MSMQWTWGEGHAASVSPYPNTLGGMSRMKGGEGSRDVNASNAVCVLHVRSQFTIHK